MDRTNAEWIQSLSATGSQQAEALVDLRELLLRGSLYTFSRNLADFGRRDRHEILQLAEDCAQDALVSVLDCLADFRGESRFTTWAYKFAINKALASARRERWKGVSLQALLERSDALEMRLGQPSGPQETEKMVFCREVVAVIREIMASEMTPRQRDALQLVALEGVPMDVAVDYFGTNRNAVYKLLHDARKKIKTGLQARGYTLDRMLSAFGHEG